MKIGFVGLGKLGLPCALAVESKGHEVCGYDIDPKVGGYIKSGKIPYREIMVDQWLPKTKINFTSLEEVVTTSEIVFVPIQTPHDPNYEGTKRLPLDRKDFDYSWLQSGIIRISEILDKIQEDRVVIIISTVLPGTIDKYIRPFMSKYMRLCYNPFFIAMGTTFRDFLNPEFVLFGVEDEYAATKAEVFYRTLHSAPFCRMSIQSAELTKVAYNTFIGMKIVFANTVMEICHKIPGANCDDVIGALQKAKERLVSPKYLRGGMGDGGGCHPRDNIAMSWLASELALSHNFFEDLMYAREHQTEFLAELILDNLRHGHKHIVILGKAFKPETDLTVGSPSVLLYNLLLEKKGFEDISFWDPHIDTDVDMPGDPTAVYFLGTQHEEFKNIKFPRGSIVIDPFRYIKDQEGVKVIRIGE